MNFKTLSIEETREEVMRLAKAAAGEWCTGGGWQFPFDFGNGIIAPTYTEIQSMHIWRRQVMLDAIENVIPEGERKDMPVLDLGGGEGAMAIGLWQIGFRDITLVEVRELNIDKARFAANHFKANINFNNSTADEFLKEDKKEYGLTLFMGLLYHLLDPFGILTRIGKCTSKYMVMETALALPKLKGFRNRGDYAPSEAAFYMRFDSAGSHTAGLSDLELWPNIAAIDLLAKHAGFEKLAYLSGENPPKDFASNSRTIVLASKKQVSD